MPAGSLPMKYIREPFEYKMKALRNPSKGVARTRRAKRASTLVRYLDIRHAASRELDRVNG